MPDDVDWFLASLDSDQLARLKRYVERGRPLEHEDIGSLKDRWVLLFKQYVDALPNVLSTAEMDDIQAELTLRGDAEPSELVSAERKRLEGFLKEQLTRVRGDPSALAKFGEAVERRANEVRPEPGDKTN